MDQSTPQQENPVRPTNNRLKRLYNHYRLVIMNEDSFEEVVKFKLTRMSVYIALSSMFILMIILTVSLIIFTPLKYYLPGAGYGSAREVKELRKLKIRTDSIQKALDQQIQFNQAIEKALKGKFFKSDTNLLKLPKNENIDD